jgi:phage tail sheath protein FI
VATTYKTPGVYVEEIPKFPPSVAPVATAVPAFIGYTEKAFDEVADDLILKPKRVESLVEFEQYFGGPQLETEIAVTIEETTVAAPGAPVGFKTNVTLAEADRSKHILYYAMQHFYANGGGRAYIVSVGKHKARGTDLVLDEFRAALPPLSKVDEPTLIVVPEAPALDIGDFKTLAHEVLQQCRDLGDRFAIVDVHGGDDDPMSKPDSSLVDGVQKFRDDGLDTSNLNYGAAYAPFLETVLDYAFDESVVEVTYKKDGAVEAGFPATLESLKPTPTQAGNSQLYERARTAIRAMPLVLPPSPAMAGIYTKVDNERGVWKAPANVSVNAVIKPTIEFSNREQDDMNVDATGGKSVNAIRPFVGKGTLVWGARTLAGNDNEWRYVNVRRFFIFVEESVKKATEQFTFEANDANTWVKVQGMIENFLTTQWRAGALQGIKPEHAFYVSVGLGKTMTPLDILEGRMIVEIGMAAVRPAEFIILRFSHKMAES